MSTNWREKTMFSCQWLENDIVHHTREPMADWGVRMDWKKSLEFLVMEKPKFFDTKKSVFHKKRLT
jgi:hypothetical protein